MQQRVLITGARGLVGSELAKQLDSRAIPFSHADCDITDPSSIQKALDRCQPSAVFNCAAQPNVDGCETDPETAFRVNGTAVAQVARFCEDRHIPLVHFSTDYVFDGSGTTPFSEDHLLNPLSVYGKSKRMGEQSVQDNCSNWIIARIQLVFGSARRNFVIDTARKLRDHGEVRAFSDQVGSSSYAVDIAEMVIRLFDAGHRGVFHVRNDGYASRVEVAEEIARLLRIANPKIIPVSLKDMKLPAARPPNCRVSIEKMCRLGIHPPTWQDAVKRYLKEMSLL